MAEPNIKTGGYTNNNSNIRTAKSTGVNTGHNAAQHNSGRLSDNLSGWIGEPDTNSTTDTGIEAVNVAVLPAAKKVAGKAVNKVVDSLVEKATSSIAAPKRYKVSPSSMNAIRKNVSTEHKSNTSSGIRTSRQYVLSNRLRTGGRSIALPSKIKTRQQRNHTGQPVSAIKTSRQNISARRKTIINAVKSGKLTYRKPEKVNRFTWNKSMPPKTSNAHIDNSKVSDTGYESVQGIRASNDKVKQAAHIGKNIAMATGAAATIMTGRYINENAKLSLKGNAFQGNTTFKRFYATNAKIDKESTTNTGKEIIQGTRIAVKTGRNAVVGVKNTVRGAKKTYKVGRQIYTKTKTVVRNTSKTIKSIKNAKTTADKAKIIINSMANAVKSFINSIKTLANPLVIQGLAAIAVVLLIIVMLSGAVQSIATLISSNFGWLYDPSQPTLKIEDVLSAYKDKVLDLINDVNLDYEDKRDRHRGYEYGFDDVGSELRVNSDTYRDILAILIVYKQKLYGEGIYDTDPSGVYNIANIMNLSNGEIKDVLKRFYLMTTRSDTYVCGGCECDGHDGSHLSSCPTNCTSSHRWHCSGCECDGHSALYVKIVNLSRDNAMNYFRFTAEEKDRAIAISDALVDIEAGNY